MYLVVTVSYERLDNIFNALRFRALALTFLGNKLGLDGIQLLRCVRIIVLIRLSLLDTGL